MPENMSVFLFSLIEFQAFLASLAVGAAFLFLFFLTPLHHPLGGNIMTHVCLKGSAGNKTPFVTGSALLILVVWLRMGLLC